MIEPIVRLCAPDRPEFARPFCVDGYTVATDGKMFLAILAMQSAEDEAREAKAPAREHETIHAWLAELPSGRAVSLAALRTFAGAAVWGSPCKTCDGTGKVAACPGCNGSGTVEHLCGCGISVDHDCDECAGTGTMPHGERRPCRVCEETGRIGALDDAIVPVRVEGVAVDRRRLARLLACVPDGDAVQIAVVENVDCLALWGADWHARLMGTRRTKPTATFGESAPETGEPDAQAAT